MNTFALVAVLAVVCTAVTAFSENFFDEEALYSEEPLLSRVARRGGSGPGGKGNQKEMDPRYACCCGKKCEVNSKEFMKIAQKCYQDSEFEENDKRCAFMTCLAQKNGMLDDDENFDFQKLCDFMKKKYDEAIHSAMDKFCNEAKEKLSEKAKKCAPLLWEEFASEVLVSLELNCPEGSKVESDLCEKKRNMAKEIVEERQNKEDKGGH